MHKHLFRSTRLLFIGLDIIVLNLVLFLGKLLYDKYIPKRFDMEYYQLVMFLNVAWLAISLIIKPYKPQYISFFETFCRKTMHAYVYFTIICILYLYFYRKPEISRVFMTSEIIAIALGFFLN